MGWFSEELTPEGLANTVAAAAAADRAAVERLGCRDWR